MGRILSKISKSFLVLFLVISNLAMVTYGKESYQPGATVVKDENSPSGYTVHFVLDDTNLDASQTVESVSVTGPFRYVDPKVSLKDKSNSYTPDQYQNGMYATNCAPAKMEWAYTQEMTLNDNGDYETSFPITSGSFAYNYVIKYKESADPVQIDDPANPSPAKNNPNSQTPTGDLIHSIVYGKWDEVKQSNSPNLDFVQVYDGQKGTQFYEEYVGLEGKTQYIGIYLPANYDSNRTTPYKTIYASHGGGGNETDWFAMGHADNIMDYLIGTNQTTEAIVVTMDNAYYQWDYSKIEENVLNYIIPHMESKYNVSKDPFDRAFCGLSMGGMTTTHMYFDHPQEFGYFGIFSGTDLTAVKDDPNLRTPKVMAAVGTCDIASETIMPGDNIKYEHIVQWAKDNQMTNFVDGGYIKGSHDWFVWSQCFKDFVTKVAWSDVDEFAMETGVSTKVDETSPTGYTSTFTYENKEATKVVLDGTFAMYKEGDNTKSYSPYEYEQGMFPCGYDMTAETNGTFEMKKVPNSNYWTIDLPLPGGEYIYNYKVYDESSDEAKDVFDPANLPLTNDLTQKNAVKSYFYVPIENEQAVEDAVILPRNDGKVGKVEFKSYLAVDKTQQPLGIYTPYGYDKNRQVSYPVIYVSHGGGGNEIEWLCHGSIPNIMDNLIASNMTKEAIVVTMDNTYFNWDNELIIQNIMECIIPYIEENYNVSTSPDDRAFCGLSMGGLLTTSIYSTHAKDFGYLGIWSATDGKFDPTKYKDLDFPKLMLGAGTYDFGLGNEEEMSGFYGLKNALNQANIEYDFYMPNGAHDWRIWRSLFIDFASDVLWTKETTPPITQPDDETEDNNHQDTTTNKNSETSNKPKTGDTSPIIGLGLLTCISLIGASILLNKKRV